MFFDRGSLTDEQLVTFYRALVLPRLIEEKMLLLLRQGRISKWFSGIGQEAIAVGATLAMEADEWIMPLHRNLGVFTTRNMPLHKLFLQWQGDPEGYSKGRERSFHFGSPAHHICGMISHLGPQLSVADGTALAARLQGAAKAALAFTGEGGTSEGEFHEALNLAAVWDLPVIFLIENNGYALSTPIQEQYRCEKLSDRAAGYGMKGFTISGNSLTEVYHTVRQAREYCVREHKPVLIECLTYRLRGHEEASGTKYIPAEQLEAWAAEDPVLHFENYLEQQNVLSRSSINNIREEIRQQVEAALAAAPAAAVVTVDTPEELADVYAKTPDATVNAGSGTSNPAPRVTARGPEADSRRTPAGVRPGKRFIDALSSGLRQAMQKHKNLLLMGQDIAEYGGAFKITEGFLQDFGHQRVRNTPLCESAVLGAALGLSLEGFKSIVEMQFADFVTCGFNQIVNNLAKIHYRWGQNADVVIRMPTGAGIGAGPFHSQSNEAWFMHTPGLKVLYPATAEDAKGLLLAAVEDPNPVLFFEHKALYRSISGQVPEEYFTTPIGRARQVSAGSDASIITYGMGVQWAETYARQHPDLSLDILDLRSLSPLDHEMIYDSVRRTGKVCVLHEGTLTAGAGAEIAALIAEHCFERLDAPVLRCASLDTPVPFAPALEKNFLAESRLEKVMEKLLGY